MEHYVGLDVSLKLTAICIVDRTGKIQREGVVHSDPEAIAAFIKSNAPHVARIRGLGHVAAQLELAHDARKRRHQQRRFACQFGQLDGFDVVHSL